LLAQVTDHFTPALTGSLVITTASDTVAPTCKAAGAAELKETAIGGVGVVLMVEEPHATNATFMLKATSSKSDWRNLIAGLRATNRCRRLTSVVDPDWRLKSGLKNLR
jgi:hypothetical protein